MLEHGVYQTVSKSNVAAYTDWLALALSLSCSFSSRALSLEAIWPLYLSMSSGVSMLFFYFSEYALQYSQESFLGLWNEKLNSLQKTLLYVIDEAGIISSAVHFAL